MGVYDVSYGSVNTGNAEANDHFIRNLQPAEGKVMTLQCRACSCEVRETDQQKDFRAEAFFFYTPFGPSL